MEKKTKEEHAKDLIKFGMQFWENPLAQEYILLSAKQMAKPAFLLGAFVGISGTVFGICLLKILFITSKAL